MAPRPRLRSLAQQLLALQVAVIVGLVAVGAVLAYGDARRDRREVAEQHVLAVVESLAGSPYVLSVLDDPDPSWRLQPYAEQVRHATRTDFVVFMRPDRVRYSHPNPAQIGKAFIGTIEPAVRECRSFTETFTGTFGPSVRAVAPIGCQDGSPRALVSVGITLENVGRELRGDLLALFAVVSLALLAATAGTYLVSRRFRRQTHGLSPEELTQMYEYYEAVLHSVREGLLLVDRRRFLQLANDEAIRLLDLAGDASGRPVGELALPEPLTDALTSGRECRDEIHVTAGRVLVVNQQTARWEGHDLGTVVTLRDHTDLQALTGELDSVRGFAEALRAQAHESANRLHTVVTMIELGHPERAVEFATQELASAQELADRLVDSVDEPALAALLLGKAAQAHEKGVELTVTPDTAVRGGSIEPRDLVTLVGNLVDNAIDAALAGTPPRWVSFTARSDDDGLSIRVADSGPGLDPERMQDAFTRGWSTKPAEQLHGRGLGLALVGQVINRYDGSVDVGNDGGAVFTVRLPLPVGDEQ